MKVNKLNKKNKTKPENKKVKICFSLKETKGLNLLK